MGIYTIPEISCIGLAESEARENMEKTSQLAMLTSMK